jgi:hypothetical protein
MALEHKVRCDLPLLLAGLVFVCVVPQPQLPSPLLLLPLWPQLAQQAAAAGA